MISWQMQANIAFMKLGEKLILAGVVFLLVAMLSDVVALFWDRDDAMPMILVGVMSIFVAIALGLLAAGILLLRRKSHQRYDPLHFR